MIGLPVGKKGVGLTGMPFGDGWEVTRRRLDWAHKQLDEAGANYVRLEGVVIAADRWRATLDLDQTSFEGLDFCCEFAEYDAARHGVRDLLPMEGDEAEPVSMVGPTPDLDAAVQAADRVFAKEPG